MFNPHIWLNPGIIGLFPGWNVPLIGETSLLIHNGRIGKFE